MEGLVEYIVKALVKNPDEVQISRKPSEDGYTIEVRVHPDDMGRIIGRQGPYSPFHPHHCQIGCKPER